MAMDFQFSSTLARHPFSYLLLEDFGGSLASPRKIRVLQGAREDFISAGLGPMDLGHVVPMRPDRASIPLLVPCNPPFNDAPYLRTLKPSQGTLPQTSRP